MSLTSNLNPQQLDAVLHGDGPCLVLAGAGSGKTKTITHRVAHLLAQGVEPESILLVTFTNKAAREMVERVKVLTEGTVVLPWAGTFHHIAYRLLKRHAAALDFPSSFTILDSADSLDIFKQCLKAEGYDRSSKRFPSPAVVQSLVSYSRNAEETIAEVLDLKYPSWVDLVESIERIAEMYANKKREANTMDFDDLLVFLARLLNTAPQIHARYAEQFHHILVDEYQDTNRIQASMVNRLATRHRNLLVVGDDAQSIYSFRAAEIRNILDFKTIYPDAKMFRLETNYRSTPEILDVANAVILQNRLQHQKILKSVQPSAVRPEVHGFDSEPEEAEWIADRIEELMHDGTPADEIAVLFRAAFHSQALEVELVKRRIPYDYRGGVRFFERAHVKDVLGYLRILANPADQIAWRRVLTLQSGIGPAIADRILLAVQGTGLSLFDAAFSDIGSTFSFRGGSGWSDFMAVISAMSASDRTPAGLIQAVSHSPYREYLEREYPDYPERLEDIVQLALFAKQADDLSTFLAEVTMQESYTGKEQGTTDRKIVLSTIHQAKGLEWKAVFVIGLSNGKFPHERSLRDPGQLEEERRLLYVAVTRARQYLSLSYSEGGIGTLLGGPSMFLEEIDQAVLDADTSLKNEEISYEFEPQRWEKKQGGFLRDIGEL